MSKPPPTNLEPATRKPVKARPGLIHPVVIYPFQQPDNYSDLCPLYEMIAQLDSDKKNYARPLTVMDRKTHLSMAHNPEFLAFKTKTVGRCSEILDAWCVDTCQMWYTGLGLAYERGGPHDVYWLIPGDFNYGAGAGQEVLGRLHDLPEIIVELDQDLCVGEIAADHNHSKQLIDTYATFALLYNWFPEQAKEIRQFTERPRSEFFAVRHSFLAEVLAHRWYPYEQTMVMLLLAVFGRKSISRFFVGNISDLPGGRESLNAIWQQVERTERVLKSLWRERHSEQGDWSEQYRLLEARSEQIRRTALTILENLLA
jgi:hypothetical protein